MLKREPTFGTPVTGPLGRAAERRRSAATLLAAVASGPSLVRDPRGARERLEEELRHALQARSVMLRDDPSTLMPPPANASCFDVPLPATDARARLEAVFDTPRALDDWSCQLIDAATHLAAILLELERAGGRGPTALMKRRADGAAPLIGSSDAIRRVRDRIERVAATDFTVLIEGPSCR